MAAYQPRKQREHNLAVSPSGGNCNQAARACRAVSRTRPPARPTKSVVPETLRHSRPRYPGPHSSKHAFVSGGHRARGRGAASPTLSAGVKKQIRGGEVFDRTVWPKRCRTGNRHHRESSRETNAALSRSFTCGKLGHGFFASLLASSRAGDSVISVFSVNSEFMGQNFVMVLSIPVNAAFCPPFLPA